MGVRDLLGIAVVVDFSDLAAIDVDVRETGAGPVRHHVGRARRGGRVGLGRAAECRNASPAAAARATPAEFQGRPAGSLASDAVVLEAIVEKGGNAGGCSSHARAPANASII